MPSQQGARQTLSGAELRDPNPVAIKGGNEPRVRRTATLPARLDQFSYTGTLVPCLRTLVRTLVWKLGLGVLLFENRSLAEMVLGRSMVRRRIVALLVANPSTRLHLREIQRRVGTSPGTASRELARLVSAGLIERETEGNQVYFHSSGSPQAALLYALLAIAPPVTPPPPTPPGVPATSALSAAAAAVSDSTSIVTTSARAERRDTIPLPMPTPMPGSLAPGHHGTHVDAATIETEAATTAGGGLSDPVAARAAAALVPQLRRLYADRLRGLYAYGPRATGHAVEGSDVELLVVLDDVSRYGDELERTSLACASLSIDLGVVVSRVFLSQSDWTASIGGRLAAIRAEAVAL
jgi:DNA-binding transcriptional ArsR family regulator